MPRTRLEDLHHRQTLAEQGGGPARVAQQHRKGKLTARERDVMMMQAKVKASWLLTVQASWMADMGEPNNLEASICKCKAGRDMVWVCQKAVELMGPEGYSRKELFEKWMRDSKIGDIHEGTQQIQKLVVARRIFDYGRDELA